MACQVFHSGLTMNQSKDIENIQKRALKIILGKSYHSYEVACTIMSAEPLSDRRQSQCLKFIRKAVKGGLHSDIFKPAQNSIITRSSNMKLLEYTCNTQRYFNSPLVFLSRLYNQNLNWEELINITLVGIYFSTVCYCDWWIMGTGPNYLYCAHLIERFRCCELYLTIWNW